MEINTNTIKEAIYSDFSKEYTAFGNFVESGEIWDLCIAAVMDELLMNNIIFCNDVHMIPPVNSFVKAKKIEQPLSGQENRSIGAFWGFVFKCVFEYQNQKVVASRVNTIKTATYFFDNVNKVTVKEGTPEK